MNTTTRAALAAFALPLLLSLAPQGSCGGGVVAGGDGGDKVSTQQHGDGKAVAEGLWGGEGVRLEVGAEGASVEFDCAHGTLAKLVADASGDFSAAGTFTREGGPARGDGLEQKRPARYSGKVEGKTMTLRLAVEGLDDAPTFKLTHGAKAELRKCL